ncbi:MAG: Type 1 glutamine amidotransferase-like domain-containing protein [Bacilli bacterium]|nr:Type 1 glutamine amidotransferase-like domain-containing protein [Bacilli bacterium]
MKCMLIGGGEVGRGNSPYETKEIDLEIVKMTEKVRPVLLFIGFASSHSDSYYDVIKQNFQRLGCETTYLKKSNCLYNPEIVKSKFMAADIIYVGGGDTLKLLDRIEEYQLKPLFKAAMERNCVMAGISAGAILFAERGYSDSFILRGELDSYEMIPGFGYVPITICPHYKNNTPKTNALEKYLENHPITVFGLENGSALKIQDKEITSIHSLPDASSYLVYYENGIVEKKI